MSDTQRPIRAVELFYSYAHKDEALREALEAHLSVLKRENVITSWHDRMIDSGSDWAGQIDDHINSARIILLLVSADFLASQYCYDVEMKRAFERHQADEARVIPVILRPCEWTHTQLGKLQGLPKGGKPVTTWEDQDEALLDVAKGIRKVIEQLPVKSEPGSGPRYDVFLCHDTEDAKAVKTLEQRLTRAGIRLWQDKGQLVPDDPSRVPIKSVLADCDSCAVFIGPRGLGTWQTEEMRAAIEERMSSSRGGFWVIPVLLPGAERPDRSRLPNFLSTTTWAEFRRSLNDEEPFRRLISGIRGEEPPLAPVEDQCPYRGLQPFEEVHSQFFFGREAMTEWLLDALRPPYGSRPENRFLAVLGPSGSGKSSLALAGLVPALKRGELGDGTPWPVVICRPGYDPLESLAVQLAPVMGRDPGLGALRDLIAGLKDDQRALHLSVRMALRDGPATQRLVVLVDQFEEAFTLCQDGPTRQALIDSLLYAANIAGGQTVVVLTLRADFVGKCALYPGLAAALSSHQLLVGPMTEDELRRAIVRPAKIAGCELETGLTDLLLQDVERQPGALPLLQYALRELWERREGRRLTGAAYRAIGGLEGALENRANAVLKGFTPAEQTLCRRIFLRLTRPGEGTEDTKRRVRLRELGTAVDWGANLEGVIQRLVDARLITAEGEEEGHPAEGGMIEVAHEALIRGWKELRQWIDADRAGLRIQHRLSEAAREWEATGRHPSYLYNGARLAVAREWAAVHPGELTALEAGFLASSEEAERQREAAEVEVAQQREADARRIAAETKKKLRASRLALASVLVAIVFGSIAVWSRQSERDRRSRLMAEARSALESALSRAAEARTRKDLLSWDGAVHAGERALSLARSGIGDDAFLTRVKVEVEEIQKGFDRAKKDAEIRRRLEEARIYAAGSDAEQRGHGFDLKSVVTEYRKAFRDYGIDLDGLPNPNERQIIQTSDIRETLIAALNDFYADLLGLEQTADHSLAADLRSLKDLPLGIRLYWLARQADPDDHRRAVSDALLWHNRSILKRIARELDVAKFPSVTIASLGRALKFEGEADEAIMLLQRAQRFHPSDFWINYLLAWVLSDGPKTQRYEEALRYYTAAQALRPDSPGVRCNIGRIMHRMGDFDGAIASQSEAIALDPNLSRAYYNRGLARKAKKEYDKAIIDYTEAIRLNPQYAAAYDNRGVAWKAKKQYDKAIADYSEAIRLNPRDALAYNNRGNAWLVKEQHGKAVVDYTEAIRLNPQYALAYNNRGDAWLAKKQHDKAVTDYSEAIRFNPKYAAAYSNRGMAWKATGQYDKAIADYSEAIRLNPRDAFVCNELAWLLATCPVDKLRDSKKAVGYATKACQLLDFQDYVSIDTLAATYAEDRQFDEAVKAQQKAIGLLSGNEGNDVAVEMQKRLQLYKAKKPYRDEPN